MTLHVSSPLVSDSTSLWIVDRSSLACKDPIRIFSFFLHDLAAVSPPVVLVGVVVVVVV
jgi:hypothetical protein